MEDDWGGEGEEKQEPILSGCLLVCFVWYGVVGFGKCRMVVVVGKVMVWLEWWDYGECGV